MFIGVTFLSLGKCRFFVTMDSKKEEIFLNLILLNIIYIGIVYFSLYRYTITQVIKGDYNVHFIHEKYFKILRLGRQT